MGAISAAWALSFLPIPILWGRFGPNGGSLGWHQARELLRNQGQAQLFWIDKKGVERVTAAVFNKLATEPLDGRDRAPTPEAASLDERANIALFGCIIEQIETDLKKQTAHFCSTIFGQSGLASVALRRAKCTQRSKDCQL
jgi:hypothetical protein